MSRSEATRARLRRAAIDVFANKGFHATKVSDIVAAAGVTQPTFYLYFASKKAAFDALVNEFRAALLDATRRCLIPSDIALENLYEGICERFIRFLTVLTQDRSLTEIGFFQRPSGDLTQAMMIEWVTENMVQEQQIGILRQDIPVAYQARLVVGLLDQMARMDDPAELEYRAGICARLFCDALGAKHAP